MHATMHARWVNACDYACSLATTSKYLLPSQSSRGIQNMPLCDLYHVSFAKHGHVAALRCRNDVVTDTGCGQSTALRVGGLAG
jgi:hypothetical protein